SLAAVDGVADNAVIEGETDNELEYNAHLLVKPLLLDDKLAKQADFAIGGAATWGRTHGTLVNPGIAPIKSAGQATIYKFAGGDAFNAGLADPMVSVRRARAGTVGINWYFNKLFKLQLNYEGTVYTGGAPNGGNRPTEHLISTRFQAAI